MDAITNKVMTYLESLGEGAPEKKLLRAVKYLNSVSSSTTYCAANTHDDVVKLLVDKAVSESDATLLQGLMSLALHGRTADLVTLELYRGLTTNLMMSLLTISEAARLSGQQEQAEKLNHVLSLSCKSAVEHMQQSGSYKAAFHLFPFPTILESLRDLLPEELHHAFDTKSAAVVEAVAAIESTESPRH